MKQNKNEELQSRRQFFKRAAKGTLPILAAAVLSSTPFLGNASEAPMGCKYGCSGSCYGSCSGSCSGTCSYTCSGTCRGGCNTGCLHGCGSTCHGACTRTSKTY